MREVDLIGRIETPISLRARMNANAVTTTNYNELGNKPKINGVTLYGDLTPEELGIFYGAPFVANTVAEMTNTDKVYVYTGSETGYVAGNWYYYNGSEWVSGGVYNSAAVQTDRTLTQEDKAADAKVVGDALATKAGIIEDTVTGEIVSFVPDKTIDKLLDASLEMSPIQSLNGYDSPWPGGGGKNLFGGEYNVNFPLFIAAGTTVTAYSDVASSINYYKSDGTTRIDYWSVSSSGRTFTLSEDAYYFRFNGASSTPTKMYVAKESSFSGYSPYSNICPISGHTGAELIRTGKNLGELSADNISQKQRATFAYQNGGVVVTATGTYARGNFHFKTKVGQKYTISFKGKIDSAIYGRVYFGNTPNFNNEYSHVELTTTEAEYTKTITATNEDLYVSLYLTNGSQSSGVMTIEDFQLELGSATEYEPYDGDTYSASFASAGTVYSGTVYGGSYDFISGALKENIYHDRLLSTAAWYMQTVGGHNYFCTTAFKTALTTYHNLVACTHFGVGGNASALDDPGDCTITNAYGRYYPLNIRCDAIASVDDFKTFLANNEVYVSIEAAPREYTLSAQQLTTLQGQNVVWGNGTATVKYAADAKTYIDNKIAAAVAALS